MRNDALLLLTSAILLTGCGGSSTTQKTAEIKEPVQTPEVFQVKFETTKGPFTIEVHRDWAPRGADRFHELIREGFYNEAKFYRVVRNFVVQWGIHADPEKDKLWRGIEIPDDPVKEKNVRGTITFATAGPNTRATQVFINLGDNTRLDGDGFAPFGRVIDDGMKVVDQLAFVYGDVAPRGAGPDPKQAQLLGNVYFERAFPRLDGIKSTEIVSR